MFNHYIASALRHFARHKVTTTVNVLYLCLGLIAFALAYGVEAYSRYMDTQHDRAGRTYFLTQATEYQGRSFNPGPMPQAGFAFAPLLKAQYPQLEQVARVTGASEIAVAVGKTSEFVSIAYADPGILEIFDLDFVAGDPRSALQRPHSVVIGAETAKRLFGDKDPIGQTLLLNNSVPVHVAGVVKLSQAPSMFSPDTKSGVLSFSLLASMDTREALIANRKIVDAGAQDAYFFFSAFTYVLFRDDTTLTPDQLRRDLAQFVSKHEPNEIGHATLGLRPIDQFGRSLMNVFVQTNRTGISLSSILLFTGSMILGMACLNYANLASAQTAARFKELALRRTVGAHGRQIVAQIFMEAFLIVTVAMAIAAASLPGVVAVLRAGFGRDYGPLLTHSPEFWCWWLFAMVVAALLASTYPAIVAIRVRPAQALHSGRVQSTKHRAMRFIVGAQCVAASLLLVQTSIMRDQIDAVRHATIAATDDVIVSIGNNLNAAGVDHSLLQDELRNRPHLISVSAIDNAPGTTTGRARIVMFGAESAAPSSLVSAPWIDYDYFSTMGESILAGRDYDKSIASDLGIDNGQSNIIIDATLAARYGWTDPKDALGQYIYEPNTGAAGAIGVPKTVIGVVRNQDLYPIAMGIAPGRFYMLGPDRASTILIRVSKEHVAEGVAEIDEVWRKLAPTVPIKRRFLDEQLQETSARLLAMLRVADLLSYLALFVATLGVVGIATHSINQRMFEIGIRKSLGAGSIRVLVMLLKDFAKPIVIANCIAWPLAFVVGKAYLTLFSDPIALTIRPFIFSLLIGIAIAWLAIGRQALRAARINPARVLRHE